MVYETSRELSPGGIVDDARNGGDPPAPTAGQSTAETMQAMIKYLPQYMQTVLPQILPAAQANLAAQQATSPQTSQLQADMYKQVAPQLNEVAQQMDASNKMAGSQADLSVLLGPGAQAAQAAQGIDQSVNPEFYNTRTQTGNTIAGLLSGGLTPAEEEAISRQLAQANVKQGIMGTPTTTSTVSNAMTFGDAARQRQLQGVQAATSFLPVSRSIDPTQVALGRPSQTGQAQSQFMGVSPNPGSTATDSANSLFGQIAGFQNQANQINSQRRDSLDRTTGVLSSLPSVSG